MQLVAEELIIDRGGRRIIDGVSFVVEAGATLVLTGANGAGKTTLLRAIAGFLRPVSGRVYVNGGDADRTLAEQSHIVGHSNAVKPSFTVLENVAFWADYLAEGSAREQIRPALEHFGLEDLADFPAAYLSAGQKRRLGLSRILAVRRPIWLLDEPSASLDAASTVRLETAINTHTAAGGIVVVATHLPLKLDRALELNLDSLRMAA